ncbi:MAG: aldo/keto reductase, partial [Candidatus Schekmanbacteria bacterium]
GYDEVLEDLEESLKNLQTDKIEIYQIHELGPDEVEQVMRKDGALDAFKRAKSEGMIDFIGLTSHHTQVMVDLIKTGEFDTVMFPFNVIEREPEAELVGLCRSLNVGTIVMKALAGGVIRNIENSHRFLCGYPLDNILVGCATVDELNENIDFMEKAKPLSAEELKKFEEEVAPLGKDFCRRCNYCMPCPNDIIIPVMIHLTWQRMKGQGYEKMSSHEKERAKNLSIWWQACTECGECEQKCPYDLPTIERKRELMEKFS